MESCTTDWYNAPLVIYNVLMHGYLYYKLRECDVSCYLYVLRTTDWEYTNGQPKIVRTIYGKVISS